MDYKIYLIEAKYHLAVAERLMKGYKEYPEKRFLVGVISELAKALSKLIHAVLIKEDFVKNGADAFFKKIAPKYLEETIRINLMKIIEVAKAQRASPIEFTKGDNIILLIHGKYRFLTVDRIREFMKSTKDAILTFSTTFRQI
ncbi:MAG: hypothetical protein OEL87_02075 [Nanoarchaeota archaeon]|nr:hypothetical protein [Nanoarchaeota archaeon]